MRRCPALLLLLTIAALALPATAAAAPPVIRSVEVFGCGPGSLTPDLSKAGRVTTIALMQRGSSNAYALPQVITRSFSLPAGRTTMAFERIAGRPLSAFPKAIHAVFLIPYEGLQIGRAAVVPVGNICA